MTIEYLYQLFKNNDAIVYTKHAYHRMIERNITMNDVMEAVKYGSIIEINKHPQYTKYLVCGKTKRKYLHVVIKVTDIGVVITVYYPDNDSWTNNYTVRIRKETDL